MQIQSLVLGLVIGLLIASNTHYSSAMANFGNWPTVSFGTILLIILALMVMRS